MSEFEVSNTICTNYLVRKQHRKAIPKQNIWRAKEIPEFVHSDICGTITPTSNSEKRYVLWFIDDYSRKAWSYLLGEKSETLVCFKNFKNKVETKTSKMIKALRTYRGGEFTLELFKIFCTEHGIIRKRLPHIRPSKIA